MASKLTFGRSPAAVEALYSPSPTIASAQQSTTTITGATLVAATDARLKPRQAGPWTVSGSSYAPTSRYSYVWDSPPAFGFAFQHTGTQFELLLVKTSATSVRIKVNGQRVQDLPELMSGIAGGATFVYKVTFATGGTRQIQVEGQYATVRGVFVNTATDSIAAPPAFNARLIVAGDQITVGLGPTYNTGYGQGSWVPRFGDYASVDDPWNVSITGNTGFITGTAGTTLPERITDVTNWAPDAVIVWNGFYDRLGDMVALRTATDTYLANLKAALPNAEIYVIGCWAPAATPSSTHTTVDAVMKAAAQAANLPFASPCTGNVYNGTGGLLGSTGPWINGATELSTYVSPTDSIAPSDAGHQHIAEMMRAALIMTQANTITITDSLGFTDAGANEVIENIEEQTDPFGLTDSVILGWAGATTLAVTATLTAAGVVGRRGTVSTPVTATLTATGLLGGGNTARLTVTATLPADGRVSYQRGAKTTAVFATLSARGDVTRSAETEPLANRWYSMLPAVYRAADSGADTGSDHPLFHYLQAVLTPLEDAETIAGRIAAGQMTDAALADDQWIPWLAQAVGVAGVGVTQQRARILALTAAPAIGSVAYMVALISPLLTGTRMFEVTATPPWTITVRARADELSNVGGTADGLRDAIYATGRVPSGFLIVVNTTQQTWGQIDAATPTWAPTAGETWGEVDSRGL